VNPTEFQRANPKLKLRWFQYSLRTLFVFITLFAIACSWLGVRLKQAREQRESLTAIRSIGAEVYYAHQPVEYQPHYSAILINPKSTSRPCGPLWLRKMLGEDFFDRVVFVAFRQNGTKNASLAHLKNLTGIECVALSYTWVTDDGLIHLKGISSLRALFLDGVRITDAGLARIRGLSNLENLNLMETKITDDGLQYLLAMPNLRILDLESTRITDAGLERLKQLPNLEDLYLWGTGVTDKGVEELKKALPKTKIIREEMHKSMETWEIL
jgi:hypothetical protein